MPLTTAQQSQLVQMYVGVLGANPTAVALDTYATIFTNTSGNDTAKLLAVATEMANSSAGKAMYPGFATASQIVSKMFANIGLDGSAKDAAGVTLQSIGEAIINYPGVTVASFATALLNAINLNTFTAVTDADKMNGHLAAGAASKAAIGVNLTTGAVGTKVSAALDSALGVTPVSNDPVSKSFTTGADELVGGKGDDTFAGIMASTSTYSTGDKVDGGAGTDTVTITNSGVSTAAMTELTGVEKISVKQLASTSLDAILWKGVTEVSSAGGIGGATLTVSNLQGASPKFMLDGGSLVTTQNLAVSHLDLSGKSDTITVSLSNVSGGGALTGTGSAGSSLLSFSSDAGAYETVTIAIPASGNVHLAGTGISATTALVIEGPTTSTNTPIKLTVDGSVSAVGNLTLVGAASATSISLGAGSANSTITLGDGRDSLTIAGAGNKTVNAGDGNDVISFSSSSAGNITVNAGSGNDSVTLTNIGTHVITLGDGADTLAGGNTIGTGDTISGGSGADVLTFTAQTGTTTPTISEVETVTLTFGANGRSVNFKNVNDVKELKIVPGASTTATNAVTLADLDKTVATITFQNNGTLTGEPSSAVKISYEEDAAATLALNFTSGNNANITLDEVATLTVDVTGMSNRTGTVDGAYKLEGTLTLNSGSDEDPMSVIINSRSGGDLSLAATSNVEVLTINSFGTGASGATRETLQILQGFSNGSNTATGASGLQSLTLLASTANLTFTPELNAPNLSTVSITAGGNTTVKLNALTNSDSVNVTSISVTMNNGSAATVQLDDVNLAQVADGTFKITGSTSSSVLIGTSGYLTASSGFDVSNGILDEFYSVVDARSLLGAGSLKMFSGATVSSLAPTAGTGYLTALSAGATTFGSGDIGIGSGTDLAARMTNLLSGSSGNGQEILQGISSNSNPMTIYGAVSGANFLAGGAGADTIYGGQSADLIIGGLGGDRIEAGSGNDVVLSIGSDTVYGGLGNDTIYAVGTANSTSFKLSGGSGNDAIVLSNLLDRNSGSIDTIVWTIGDDVRANSGTVVYGFTGHSTSFTASDKIDLTGTTTSLVIGASAAATTTSGQTLAFGSANSITVTHWEGQSGTTFWNSGDGTSGPDFFSGAVFSAIFGTGSGNGLGVHTGNTGGAVGVNVPFATTLSSAEWNSGYGVSFAGTSGASAVLSVEGSGGDTYLLLLSTTQSSGIQTLTTANLVSVITLDGYTAGGAPFVE